MKKDYYAECFKNGGAPQTELFLEMISRIEQLEKQANWEETQIQIQRQIELDEDDHGQL